MRVLGIFILNQNFFDGQGSTRVFGPRIAGQESVHKVPCSPKHSENKVQRKKDHLWMDTRKREK